MFWLSRLRNAIAPQRLDEDLHDELADHIARRAASLRSEGVSEEEAHRRARVKFGNATQIREQSREIRLASILETTLQDLRYAWRGMIKSPAFALTAIGSLALAIGANTAIYSIVDAALLRPLPVTEPDRLFRLATPQIQDDEKATASDRTSFSYPEIEMFRRAAGNSARLALFSYGGQIDIQIPDSDAPYEHAVRQFVSGDAFDILHVPPALGRVFTTAEDRVPGGHPYVVLSYDYWQKRFQGDPRIEGLRMQIWGKPYTVLGVAQKGFSGVEPGKFVDIWMPAMMFSTPALSEPGWSWFQILGRLSPGATGTQLQARLQPVYSATEAELVKRFPTMPATIQTQFRKRSILVYSGATGASSFQTTFARPLWIVFGVAAGILWIACANAAGLLLARSTARAPEIAMRISIGASRARLVRQLLTESLLLSLIAGACGWALAQVAAPAMVPMLSSDSDPVRLGLAMDTRALLFCAVVSALAVVVFGVLPAWQASRAQPMRELRGARSHAGKLRLGRVFVGVQVAFAFTLTIAGASFLFSLKNLFSVHTGFNPHNVAVVDVSTELSDVSQKPELNVFADDLQRRIEALPGVESAGLAQRGAMFTGRESSYQVIVPGRRPPDREEYAVSVSPRYFSALRLPLLAGRDFELRDRDDQLQSPRPTIVNQALARSYFGAADPIGKTFQTPDSGKLVDHLIIGLVSSAPFDSLRQGPQAIMYGVERGDNYLTLYIRSRLGLGSIVSMVERESRATARACATPPPWTHSSALRCCGNACWPASEASSRCSACCSPPSDCSAC